LAAELRRQLRGHDVRLHESEDNEPDETETHAQVAKLPVVEESVEDPGAQHSEDPVEYEDRPVRKEQVENHLRAREGEEGVLPERVAEPSELHKEQGLHRYAAKEREDREGQRDILIPTESAHFALSF